MEDEPDLPSILVLSRPSDSWKEESSQPTELRAGKWTKPKYVCSKKDRCHRAEGCKHAVPHYERNACRGSWALAMSEQGTFYQGNESYVGWYYMCSSCIGLPETRKFIPDRRVQLSKGETTGRVICPAAITSCIGRCSHAEPHAKNKYCEDQFKQEGVIHLTCRPASAYKRQLLFDGYALTCHAKESDPSG